MVISLKTLLMTMGNEHLFNFMDIPDDVFYLQMAMATAPVKLNTENVLQTCRDYVEKEIRKLLSDPGQTTSL